MAVTGELDLEQEYLTGLYARVDAMREEAAGRLAAARREGTDPARVELWRAELGRLEAAEHGLCFGRLDTSDGGRTYVGRLSLFGSGDEALLVDWRAPAARPFYTATAAAPLGVRRRRHIATRGRTVVALDDELLDQAAGEAEGEADGLVGEAALLAAVSAQRTGRMRDIVTTLRAEQDAIVRDEHRGVLVVTGGPGTGKTAVALHRLAYLLYTQPHLRTRGVLVVGPSRIFLDFVGQVLPGLGEHSVVTATIADLAADRCPGVRVGRTDPPRVVEQKGCASMADRVAAEVRSRVRTPEGPVDVEFERQALRLDRTAVDRAVRRARRTGLPHNQAGLVFQREVVEVLARHLVDRMEAVVLTETGEAIDGGSPDGRLGAADLRALAAAGVVLDHGDPDEGPRTMLDETDRAGLRDALLADRGVLAALEELWPPLTAQGVVADLLGVPAGEWSLADLPLLDEAAALVGDTGQADAPGERPTFGHVVVDEAQELSEMAWRMVMRRCPTRSMTVVGDLAQTGDPGGAGSWERALAPHVRDRWRLAPLTVNYRTPAEIMEATAGLLAAHHPGTRPPRAVRSSGQVPWRVRATEAALPAAVTELAAGLLEAGGRLAVIAPVPLIDILAVALSRTGPPDPLEPVVLLTPTQAKGLEFDSVLVVDPAAILAEPLGHNDLYVAMTRATQRLGIVHPGPPPAELAAVRER